MASTAIMQPMARLLLNLRHVPDDEADEVRTLLADAGIDVYETRPSAFGISAGAIWLSHSEDEERARGLLSEYQEQRRERVRQEFAEAQREGRVPGLFEVMRQDPMRALLVVAGVLLMLGLTALPVVLFLR